MYCRPPLHRNKTGEQLRMVFIATKAADYWTGVGGRTGGIERLPSVNRTTEREARCDRMVHVVRISLL